MSEPLIGQDLAEFEGLVDALGHPSYRARQIYRGLYRERLPGPTAIQTLPKDLRNVLEREHGSGLPSVEGRVSSSDGTVRYLLRLADAKSVETVFLPEADRDTLCLSTQVGCAVDCKFCLTGPDGFPAQFDCRRDRWTSSRSDAGAQPRCPCKAPSMS